MLSNLSMKSKLLFTVLPLTLLIYLATVLLVYSSSKSSTEALAEVAVEAIAQQQVGEISSYFDASMYSMRNTAGLLGSEMIDGELPDRRIADQMLEALFAGLPEAAAIWWIPRQQAGERSVLWLRSGGRINPALDEQRQALVAVLAAHVSSNEQVIPLVPVSTSRGEQQVIALTVPVLSDGKALGALGVGLDAGKLQERVSSLRPLDVGVAALIAHDTTLVAHPEPHRHETGRQ